MSDQDDIETIAAIVKAARVAFVTSRTADGDLHSRPLAVQDDTFTGDLWFFTQDPSEKTDEVRADPSVNVAIESGKGFLSIAGTASISRDATKIDELWSTGAEAWFPEGRDDPSVALLKVHAESAEFWAVDSPAPIRLLKYARAAVSGGQPDVGRNDQVDL
ncbi:general stress protein [Cnuibacter physcomitrellae]|uniref:General stress protein n=1 Tax=Cnuibacter physcomitrellae TaxID=1619308 RepID=A0A1X9LQS0_9MICO|nr:pyridoxamine 5'-phosphate oxidase family protein [Cnuibacter physcomitrellae]ARJ06281.1 general stress protein [Cnuibacter physcomitrellae]GGI37648.1 general stress protein [Cnuibacter physcomitrellae]